MKKLITLASLFSLAAFLVACGGTSTNVNVNASRSNSNSSIGNAANAVSNTAANVANSVSNTVGKATTDDPKDFVSDAAQGGMAEVEAGKLAASKAQNAEVKKFAQMMVTDHTKANEELKALATKKNIPLPSDMGSYKSTLDDLNKAAGADFDKAYVDEMVDDHEDDVAAFEAQANNSTDPDVKAFAAKTLPTLKKHLEMIKSIQEKMKK